MVKLTIYILHFILREMNKDEGLRLEIFKIVEGHIFGITVLIITIIAVLLFFHFPSNEDN